MLTLTFHLLLKEEEERREATSLLPLHWERRRKRRERDGKMENSILIYPDSVEGMVITY